MPCSERRKEIKRRRHRRLQIASFKRRLGKATVSEKLQIAEKLRKLTPGGETIIHAWGLDDRE